jgi:ABC-type polysaccharide/polyol phosphate export permease
MPICWSADALPPYWYDVVETVPLSHPASVARAAVTKAVEIPFLMAILLSLGEWSSA